MLVKNINLITKDKSPESHCSKTFCYAGDFTVFIMVKKEAKLASIILVVKLNGVVVAKTVRTHEGERGITSLAQEVFGFAFYEWMECYDIVGMAASRIATKPFTVVSNDAIRYKCYPNKRVESIIVS